MYHVHFFPIDRDLILFFACPQVRTEREEAEKRHKNRQAQNVNTASERKTESEVPDVIALPRPPPFSRKQTEPLKVFAFLSLWPSAKCSMICLSNGHHISNSSKPSQQRTGCMQGFIAVKEDAESRGSDSVMQAAMCSCELQIQCQGGTWVQAPISIVATFLHTTPRCCRLFFDFLFPKMLERSRPGGRKLPEWQLSQKSVANRRSLVRLYAKQLHCGHLIAEHAVKRSLNRDRLRARPATFEQLRDTLIAKFTTHNPREDFIRARRNNDGNRQGVYRTGVTKLMQLLTADVAIATTPVRAYLDPSTALSLYLELARAHCCLHDAVRTPQLCVFFDDNEMYGRHKCQVLSVHLSQACQPHQLLLQLPLARYLEQDGHITTSSQFERM